MVTEYDIPPGNEPDFVLAPNPSNWSEGIATMSEAEVLHDALIGKDGMVYFSDNSTPERTIGRLDPKTGQVTYGLHFICFQNNIQKTGFEFINNIWLMNPLFRRSTDGLFNPKAGVITPVEGCYYFVPPESREYSGDVLFE